MTTISVRRAAGAAAAGLFAIAGLAMAQDTTTSGGGWKRVGDPQVQSSPSPSVSQGSSSSQSNPNPTPDVNSNYPDQQTAQSPTYTAQAPAPNYPISAQQQQNYPQAQQQQNYPQAQQPGSYPPPPPNYGQGPQAQQYPMQAPPQQGNYQVPPQVSVPAGTYITVRVNQALSSDRNQPGDAFSATLVRPLVASGVVLAEPGQTIGGRVAQAQKAGRVEGLSKLGVELTDLTMVDGQQIPIKTTLVSRTGPSSVGRDAAGIAATTGLGAAVGAAADWGRGAAIGAGAGAAVGIIGVLVTRGEPSVIHPEQVLTFKVEQPFTVATDKSPQAFRYVQPNEYSQAGAGPGPGYGAGYGPGGPVYAGAPAYGYPYYGYPYYPYAGSSVFVGPGWGRGYYYGGRYYGGFAYRGYRR